MAQDGVGWQGPGSAPRMCGLTVSPSDQISYLHDFRPWSFLQVSFNTATQAITQGLSTGVKEELNVDGLSLTLTFSGG